jgi:drug/metabolite transporter (DMT)-like permease
VPPCRIRLWHSAWPVLALANLLWAGNIVLARGLGGAVPPVTLAYWRWTGAFLVALPFAWKRLRRDLPVLGQHWRMMLLLSATGIATYNTLCYIALSSTSALNVLLLQSAAPVVILVWAFLLFGERPGLRQAAGIALSLGGVAAIVSRGSLEVLMHLALSRGDAIVVLALAIYSLYCVMFRRRPTVHPLSFLIAAMGTGSCMILPFYLGELAAGAHITGGTAAWFALGYVAIFPSFVAYLLFNRGIELAGPGAAGQSMHLMPVFGSVLAVACLGESFRPYHAAGIALIGAGILLASWKTQQAVATAALQAPGRQKSDIVHAAQKP